MSYPPGPPAPPPGAGQPPQGGYGYAGPLGVPSPEERNWALASHVGTIIAAWLAMGFLAPLIIMLVKGRESAFIRRHAVESLNFQISLLIYLVVTFVVGFVLVVGTLGLAAFVLVPVVLLVSVAVLAVIIMATVKAADGQDYRYPLCIRLVH
jgi:uncharacterized protein